jgi:hypothetical protein
LPNATISTDVEHFDLKSLDGAFVDLVALPFGQRLNRRDMISQMSMEQQEGRGRRNEPTEVNIKMFTRKAREYEFARCIVDHNLEDANGNKLDFRNAMTLEVLHPKVGEEIETLIDELHGEGEEDLEDFTKRATSSSKEETVK